MLVKDAATAGELAARLREDDQLYCVNLSAQACGGERLGDADAIRVFLVTEIKGIELDGIVF